MNSFFGIVRRDWLLLGVCLLLTATYFFYFVNRAHVDLSIEVEKRTYFRIYWSEHGDSFSPSRHARVLVSPEQQDYQFFLTDIGPVKSIRIDPQEYTGRSVISRLTISQRGWEPVELGEKHGFEALIPRDQIAVFNTNDYRLETISSGNDPQFLYELSIQSAPFGWLGEMSRLFVMFLLLYTVGAVVSRFLPDKRYIPICLAGITGLTLVMAAISRPDVHPDEYVHIEAARYYIDHWLPPRVESEQIRHTYSRYGVSRLNSPEMYYLLAGKTASLLRVVHLPDYELFRLFNLLLLASLCLVTVKYRDSRMMAAILLFSPQLWYVFAYCNSDGFALFIGIISGWQVVSKESMLNRYLRKNGGRGSLVFLLCLAVLLGMLLLTKKNYYPYIAFLLLFALHKIWRDRDDFEIKRMFLRFFVLCLLGLSLAGIRVLADYSVNGLDRDEKIAAMRSELAEPLFNPETELHKRHVHLNMKERGVTLDKIIHVHRWFEKTFRSSFGVYGYMTQSATHVFYDLVRWISLAFLFFVVGSVMLRGGSFERIQMLSALLFASLLVLASLHHSWTADFQAQGRYLFPLLLMLGVSGSAAERFVSNRVFLYFSMLLFCFSCYSFIFVGLRDIPRLL